MLCCVLGVTVLSETDDGAPPLNYGFQQMTNMDFRYVFFYVMLQGLADAKTTSHRVVLCFVDICYAA